MRFYVPTIGDKLYLVQPWTFTLHEERRNYAFAVKLGLDFQRWAYRGTSKTHEITLPAKTELVVDRIYIRRGSPDFDSITFRIGSHPDSKKLGKGRFWVKLKDANKIQCELTPVFDLEAQKYWASVNDERFEELE